MKKFLCVLFVLAGLLFLTSFHFTGTNYYFKAGGTSTTCTSDADGCPLTQVASHGGPDDSVLLKKGDTFTGTINYTRSGTSGHPINFGTYGTGSNPVIDGGAETTSALVTVTGNFISFKSLIFQNARHINGLLLLSSVHDISVYNCYFNTGKRGINAVTCTGNLSIISNYFTNIFDDLQGSGDTFGGGSHIQLNNSNGASQEIAYNHCYTAPPSTGNNNNYGVGDVISLYESNGTSGSYILVHDNEIRGGSNNQTTGYIGITLGDVGGSYQRVYNNKLCNSGQGAFGIMPSGGTNLIAEGNRAYGGPTTNSHNLVGMGFNDAAGVGNCTMQNNKLTWNVYGGTIFNKFSFQTPPTGWATNTDDHVADALAYDAMLPDPLWTGTPWNSGGTTPSPIAVRGKIKKAN